MSNSLSRTSKNTTLNLYVKDDNVYEDILPRTSVVEVSQLNLPSQIAYFSGLSYDLVTSFLYNKPVFNLSYDELALGYSKFNLIKQALTTDLVQKQFAFFETLYVKVFELDKSSIEDSSLVQFLTKGRLSVNNYFEKTQFKLL